MRWAFFTIVCCAWLGCGGVWGFQAEKKDVTINLIWVNKTQDVKADFVMPDPFQRLYSKKVSWDLSPLKQYQEFHTFSILNQWAETGCPVQLWYDSKLVSPEAASNTQREMESRYPQNAPRVSLKDVWSLQTVQENPNAFEEGVNIYFRVDLLREIVAHETLLNQIVPSVCVCADWSIPPLSWEALMDAHTLTNLEEYGFVMGKSQASLFENSFKMTRGLFPDLHQVFKKHLIDEALSIFYASKITSQTVYSLYDKTFKAFLRVRRMCPWYVDDILQGFDAPIPIQKNVACPQTMST